MSAIIPCLFGTTKGFELLELAHLNFKVKDLLVAITHAEVELGLEDSCVKILRIKSENRVHTWVGLYRKAYEMGFSREGGYYGAGVWLSDATVNARQIMDALEDLCQQIRRLALQDRKFQRTLAEIEPQLVASPALNALLKGTPAPVRGGISADAKTCAFITQPQAVQDIINWAQTDAMAHNFQSIIVAPASAFPKAGASGSITQYSDLPAVERALERDYTARVAKLDALARDWQRKAQSLEAEASARNAELQALKQKNSQLAAEASRARLLVKPDSRSIETDDDASLLFLKILAVASVLGNLALGWFWYSERSSAQADAEQHQVEIGKFQVLLGAKQNEVDEALNKIAQLRGQLIRLSADLDSARSKDVSTSQNPDAMASGNATGSGESSGASNGLGGGPNPNAARPLPSCQWSACFPGPTASEASPLDQNGLGKQIDQLNKEEIQKAAPVKLSKGEKAVLKAVKNNKPQSETDLVGKKGITLGGSEIYQVLQNLRKVGYVEKTKDIEDVTRWTITDAGENYLKSQQR